VVGSVIGLSHRSQSSKWQHWRKRIPQQHCSPHQRSPWHQRQQHHRWQEEFGQFHRPLRKRSGGGTTSSEWESKRLEGKSEKCWDLVCIVAFNFICVPGNSVMIHFPRKRCLSVSTTRAIRSRDREAKKVGSLKYFGVHSVQEKELGIHDWTHQVNRHGHLPEA
jgi:hypothetical protein